MTRLTDWLRERRIKKIKREVLTPGLDIATRRRLWEAYADEIKARSPQQVARMTNRSGAAY